MADNAEPGAPKNPPLWLALVESGQIRNLPFDLVNITDFLVLHSPPLEFGPTFSYCIFNGPSAEDEYVTFQ